MATEKKSIRLDETDIAIVNKIGGTDDFSNNLRKVIEIADRHKVTVDDEDTIYSIINQAVRSGVKKNHNYLAKILYHITYLAYMTNALIITMLVREEGDGETMYTRFKKIRSIAHKEVRKEEPDISSLEHLLKQEE